MDYITAYWQGSRTATGKRPKLGTIAVNPYYIPYGTQIYVSGYGYGVARDTGAFRKYKRADGTPVNQLDLWMNTEKEGRRWARKRGAGAELPLRRCSGGKNSLRRRGRRQNGHT